MNLVVLGGEPLDMLEGWVAELFSAVPSGRGPSPEFGECGSPFEVRAQLCGGYGPSAQLSLLLFMAAVLGGGSGLLCEH